MVWSPLNHRGEHYTVAGMRFLPRPVQRPGIPVWVAGSYGKPRPLRRAARFQGFVPVDLEHPDQLAEMVADLEMLRRETGSAGTDSYEIAAALPLATDPAPYGAAGASWWLVEFAAETVTTDQVRSVIRGGPAAST